MKSGNEYMVHDKSRVSIVRCDEYNYRMVYESVKRSIELLGGRGFFC